ncbi:MAG: hypothetical protein IJS67_04755 [Clostridia bacterium]|nr:hypothetical protein [Clostridia bacterium]
MSYLLLVLSVFANASLSVFGKYYNRSNSGKGDSVSPYNFLLLLSVFVGWGVLFAFDFSFDARVLPYSAAFALAYTACNFGIIKALEYGPASLTSLFLGMSLILVTVWGFIFWNASLTVLVGVGLTLIIASIALCLSGDKKNEKKVSVKWLFFVFLAFLSNAGCSIVQRTQQIDFDGKYGEALMAFASLFSLIVFFSVFVLKGKKNAEAIAKGSWIFPVLAGISNVALNAFVILLAASELSPSLIYPTIGVGGLIVVILFSLFAFKEKLRVSQWVGILIGAIATLLLSL